MIKKGVVKLSFLSELDSDQLLILATFIALALSENLSKGDLNVLGNLLITIGSVIATKAAIIETESKGSKP